MVRNHPLRGRDSPIARVRAGLRRPKAEGKQLGRPRIAPELMPEQYRRKPTWRHVSTEIAKAAEGEKDLLEICVSLRLVLALEGVDCLVK
jgi:hypothetical protein